MRFKYILNIPLRDTLHRCPLLHSRVVTVIPQPHKVRSVKVSSMRRSPLHSPTNTGPELYLVNQITIADSQSQPASPGPFSSAPSSPVPHAPVVAA